MRLLHEPINDDRDARSKAQRLVPRPCRCLKRSATDDSSWLLSQKGGQAPFLFVSHGQSVLKAAVPRIPRGQQAGCAYHIINRGNGRGEVFHKSQDYEAFLSLLATAKARHPVKLFGFCLMPNHCHFERKVACPFMI